MKIKITCESKDQFFAEIVGEPGVHAVGKTPQIALTYLFDVYKQIHLLKKEKAEEKLFLPNSLRNSPILNTTFKSLTLSL